MKTIYKIIGGGQKVRENAENGISTEYVKVENSDFVEKAQCEGQDHYTGIMWHTDLDTLQEWANGWAGCEVELIEAESGND